MSQTSESRSAYDINVNVHIKGRTTRAKTGRNDDRIIVKMRVVRKHTRESTQYPNIYFDTLFLFMIFAATCGRDDAVNSGQPYCQICKNEDICTGGEGDLTSGDVDCIVENQCVLSYRNDSCGRCATDMREYELGSKYKDCTGHCYDYDTMNQMQTVDDCGVCGGDGQSCGSQSDIDWAFERSVLVRDINPWLIPSNRDMVLELGGKGFNTTGIRVVAVDQGTEVAEASIEHIISNIMMTVHMPGLEKGKFEVKIKFESGRIQRADGHMLVVYNSEELNVVRLDPPSFDMVDSHASFIKLSVYVKTAMDLTLGEMKHVVFAGQHKMNATQTIEDNYNVFTIRLRVPRWATILDICPSINGVNYFGCLPMSFFTPAPKVLDMRAMFTPTANALIVEFDKPVEARASTKCSDYFMVSNMFGARAQCAFVSDHTRLLVNLTRNATVTPGQELELTAGLHRESGNPKLTDLLIIRVDASDVRPIRIRPFGIWPETVSLYAKNNVKLKFIVVFKPGKREPHSITWWINEEIQTSAQGRTEIRVNTMRPISYVVHVRVTDVFGGTADLVHTITKTKNLVPFVKLLTDGVHKTSDGTLFVHPNKRFVLTANMTYPKNRLRPLSSFKFNWTRDGEFLGSGFRFAASKAYVTNRHCGKILNFEFKVFLKDDTSISEKKHLLVEVRCRDLTAKIAGANPVYLPVDRAIRVHINGKSMSRDPDGGALSYSWRCRVMKNQRSTDCIRAFGLSGQARAPTLKFANKAFRNTLGLSHNFTLTVTATKGNRTYSASDSVIYIPDNDRPYVQFLTRQHKYRLDEVIRVKAEVAENSEAASKLHVMWNFVRGESEDIDWAVPSMSSLDTTKKMKWTYASVVIRPGGLEAGRHYMIEVTVTNITRTSSVTKARFRLYIYKKLSNCAVEATDVTELEETSLYAHCDKDEDATQVSTTCRLWGITLQLSDDLTFYMPMAQNRSVKKVKFVCTIKDNLGNYMEVESNEVNLNLLRNVTASLDDLVQELEEKGQPVEALEMLSRSMTASDTTERKRAKRKKILKAAKDIRSRNAEVTTKETKRTLDAVTRLDPNEFDDEEEANEAVDIISNELERLGTKDKDDVDAGVSDELLKAAFKIAKKLVKKKLKKRNKQKFRKIKRRIRKLKAKYMKRGETFNLDEEDSDENEARTSTTGRRRRKKKETLYKIEDFDELDNTTEPLYASFPDKLKKRFTDPSECADDSECNGVVISQGISDELEEAAIHRNDEECSNYVNLEIIDPNTGEEIAINGLDEPIRINLGDTCPNAACFYYDEITQKFETTGVTTAARSNGETECHTTHLSAFTVQSEESYGEGQINFPMAIGLTFGCVLLLISSVVLVRGYLKARATQCKDKKKSTVEYVQSDLNG